MIGMRRILSVLAPAALALLLALGMGLLGAGDPARAAFPGAQGKVFFGHDGDVWTMRADGTGATKLTTNFNAEANPAVSPDGSRVAYEFFRGIWVMNADGSAEKMLTDGETTDEDPAWSADGTKIAFSRGGDIWSMNANGTGQKNLTKTPANEEYDPAFSPAGGTIVYTRTGSIWAMNPDGSGKTNLTPEDSMSQCPDSPGYFFNGSSKQPAFSPDGQKIAFTGPLICNNTIGTDIWVMDADGSDKTNLIDDNATNDFRPAFSPNGARILFESNRDGVGSPTELYSMPADGTGITRLTTNSVWDSDADWAPLDTTAPRVIAVAPTAGATDVLPGANVSAAFSEAMRANTLTRTTVRLVRRDTGVLVSATVVYNPDTMRVTLNPASNLSSGESYTATITTGARDAAGNALPANKTWSFKVR
jgi:Tol biopolymer transport system component